MARGVNSMSLKNKNLHLFKKATSILMTSVVFFALLFPVPIQADEYDDQINAIKRSVESNQAEIGKLKSQQKTLQNELAIINAEIAATQAQINLAQAEFNKLSDQLALAEQKLQLNREILGENIKILYQQSRISSIEMLASSDSFSEFVDRQQYLEAVRTKVHESVDAINALKKDLESKKKEQETLIVQQKALRYTLDQKRAGSANLLAQTQGQEAAYQQKVKQDEARISQLRAEQAAAFARLFSRNNGGANGNSGAFSWRNVSGNSSACGGGYGWDPVRGINYCNYALDAVVDRWDLYNRECVSYTAWAVSYRAGRYIPEFNGNGHAYQWPGYLGAMGYRVDGNPQPGAVAIVPRSNDFPYGHSMYVESVGTDGWIRVSQYNWGGTGLYSSMDIRSSGLSFIHF